MMIRITLEDVMTYSGKTVHSLYIEQSLKRDKLDRPRFKVVGRIWVESYEAGLRDFAAALEQDGEDTVIQKMKDCLYGP